MTCLVVRDELKEKPEKSTLCTTRSSVCYGSYLQDGNRDLLRLFLAHRRALLRLVPEYNERHGYFPTIWVRYPQHADLVHVRVIPNQDLELVSGDLESTDFEHGLSVQINRCRESALWSRSIENSRTFCRATRNKSPSSLTVTLSPVRTHLGKSRLALITVGGRAGNARYPLSRNT